MMALTPAEILEFIAARIRAYGFVVEDEQATPVRRAEFLIRRRELLDLLAALHEAGERARPTPLPVFAFTPSVAEIQAGVAEGLRVMKGEIEDKWHRRG